MKDIEIEEHNNFRKVEILRNEKWILSGFRDLKKHDEFRFSNCDGTVYKAIIDPYPRESDGVYKIHVV